MKILISPSKTLDFETQIPTEKFTKPIFLEEASKINSVLKKKSPKKIAELQSISKKLSELNWKRNQQWSLPFTLKNAKQAVYVFKGDVYIGLSIETLPIDKLPELQQKVRILSGLYGILKPLDLIQAYRLEMGTQIKIGSKINLYDFWNSKVTNDLKSGLSENELVINLASSEYYKVIQPKILNTSIITPQFKDYKNGELKTIGFFAKKARGLMVRYILDRSIEKAEDLKSFNYEGYAFDINLSSSSTFVFTR